jgi:hypothetical protein
MFYVFCDFLKVYVLFQYALLKLLETDAEMVHEIETASITFSAREKLFYFVRIVTRSKTGLQQRVAFHKNRNTLCCSKFETKM